jgi:DmsE family decaheme c-type cytochrome
MTKARIGFLAVLLALGVWSVGPPAPVAQAQSAEDCLMCHEEDVPDFAASPHGRLVDGDWFGQAQACASCHGDGTEHMASMDAASIQGFGGEEPEAENQICLSCHTSVHEMGEWPASEHAMAGLSCSDCHTMHQKPDDGRLRKASLGKRLEEDLYRRCFDCHPQVQAQIRLPSRHPLTEGHMDCGSCHNPHAATEGMLNSQFSKRDTCLDCHPKMQGPFAFQHPPAEEDCTICHNPHGAVADRLLGQTEPFLCLQCHEGHFHSALGGDHRVNDPVSDHAGGTFPPGGSFADGPYQQIDEPAPFGAEGMKRAFLTKCTQCHSAVHGSDQPSAGTAGGGRSMMR